MGFIIVAKGKQKLFFWSEVAWTVVNVGLSWICISVFGLKGAGIAFFASYVFHWLLVYPIVRRLSGFRWSSSNSQTVLLIGLLITIVFCGFYLTPFWLATTIGTLALLLNAAYSVRTLITLMSLDQAPWPLAWVLVRLGFSRSINIPA
jgi:PST family polysaccharide transporter